MHERARFFESAPAFRYRLCKNHKISKELNVGYYKKHTGRPTITWPQSVAEALCFGWIDGIRRRIDDDRYIIRFTPRRPKSKWSAVNVNMVAQLEAAGKMTEAGRAVFESRTDPESGGYTTEILERKLDAARLRAFRKHGPAWKFFERLPPGYRKKAMSWIMIAKKEGTRDRRLAQLVEASAARSRLF